MLLVCLGWGLLTLGAIAAEETPAPPQGKPDPALEADMVFIPPGPFVFGTDRTDTGFARELGVPKVLYQDEHPKQQVLSKGFYLDRHEVTNQRYKTFIEGVGYFKPPHWEGGVYPAGEDTLPVTWVNWFDASNYCDWVGKRLPTEKEWERAARGGDGLEYPWGNEFQREAAHLSHKAGSKTELKPVGSFPKGASPEGVQDLIGNVWEWTADDYAPYAGSPVAASEFPPGRKVMRGQSAAYIGHFPGEAYNRLLQEFARSGFRQGADPDQGASDVGFRCASDTKPEGFEQAALRAQTPSASNKPAVPKGSSLFGSGGGSSASASATATPAKTKSGINPFEPKSHLPTQSGMLVLLILSFLAGLFSFLSPCTLPILPAYFAVTAQADRARMTLNSFAFFCGLAALFVLMGGSASFLGSVLRDYLNELTVIGGVLVVIFGIMTVVGKGFSGANFQTRPVSTLAGYFFFGATFAMGWTPCVGPVLSGILILAASDRTIFQGMTLLFSYALGLGLPLILIALFCSKLSRDGWFWRLLRGKAWEFQMAGRPVILHSTNVFSGLLLVSLGAALALGYLTYFNNLIPLDLQIWFSGVEEKVVDWFS